MVPLSELADKRSSKAILIQGERQWTYRECSEKAHQIAAQLLADGFRPGDRLLICLENGFDLVASLLACFRIGVVVVHSYTDYSEGDFTYIAENTDFKGVITTPKLHEKMKQIKRPFASYFSFHSTPPSLPSFDPDLDQPISISYTSGTTGKSKGVVQTYRTVQTTIETAFHTFGKEAIERPLVLTSLGNNAAVMILLLPALTFDGTVILPAEKKIEAQLEAIDQHHPTFTFTYPAHLKQLLHHPKASQISWKSLKIFMVGGDIVTAEFCEAFFSIAKLRLTQGFGMTEFHFMFINLSSNPAKLGSLGKPFPGVEVKLVDAKENELSDGETGQILAKKKAMSPGYWRYPEETAKAFRNGWIYSGDLAMRDSDGFYWFRGRIKNIIIVSGDNVSPVEVEEALCRHPAVQAAGVTGIPDETQGHVVKAFVELRPKARATEGELKKFLKDLLAPYKIPAQIAFVPQLPRTLTGKLDRNALKQL